MKIGNFNLDKDGIYIIAELSTNHNASLDIALESIRVAKEIGANAIKLQTYTADSMTINCDRDDFIIKGGLWDGRKLYDLYEEASTPLKWHKQLFDYARKIGIDIFSSPFDISSVDFLENFNPIAYKIASFEISDYELVRYVARKQKPIIISTGIASIGEIQDVIDICKSENNHNIVLLKCTSSYPAKPEDANLKMINSLAQTFQTQVGLSDHSKGITAPIVASSLGAKVIEKHFILDKSIKSLDVEFSLDKNEFSNMVKAIRETEKLLGNISYSMDDKKKKNREFARSLYVVKDIKKGDVFTKDNIRSIRPGYGLHPKYLDSFLNETSNKEYKIGDSLSF